MQKILVIDDEAAFREFLSTALRLSGFEIVEAENGRAGVQLAVAYLPDLILCDINMDGFDGYAALAAIRYQPMTSTIPFILMTGDPNPERMRLGMGLGADDFLAKPFSMDTLRAAVQVQLKKQAAIRQKALSEQPGAPQPSPTAPPVEISSAPPLPPQDGTGAPPTVPAGPSIAAEIRPVATGPVRDPAAAVSRIDSTVSAEALDPVVDAYLRMLGAFHPNVGTAALRSMALCRAASGILGLSAAETQNLLWAAALHDVSLVGIDRLNVRRWLREPAKLSEPELSQIRQHPENAQEMLAYQPAFHEAGLIIRSHHEHWDGTGFPEKLEGAKIPWLARVLGVMVAYCYKPAPGPGTLADIKALSEKRFDPEAVELLRQAITTTTLPAGVVEILLNELRTGNVLGRDIIDAGGNLLVAKGECLSEAWINKLITINRSRPFDQSVWIHS